MGIAGEIAYIAEHGIGLATFHIAIIDAISKLNGEIIEEMARFDEE